MLLRWRQPAERESEGEANQDAAWWIVHSKEASWGSDSHPGE